MALEQWFSSRSNFSPIPTPGNVWQWSEDLLVVSTGKRVLLVSSGQRVRGFLTIHNAQRSLPQ